MIQDQVVSQASAPVNYGYQDRSRLAMDDSSDDDGNYWNDGEENDSSTIVLEMTPAALAILNSMDLDEVKGICPINKFDPPKWRAKFVKAELDLYCISRAYVGTYTTRLDAARGKAEVLAKLQAAGAGSGKMLTIPRKYRKDDTANDSVANGSSTGVGNFFCNYPEDVICEEAIVYV